MFSHSSFIKSLNPETEQKEQKKDDSVKDAIGGDSSEHVRLTQDPYLQKLIEIIYRNISSRFQVFENSFRYLDFKNRNMVSFDDFSKGLQGFGIAMSPDDRRQVFKYLIDQPFISEASLMNLDHFMRMKHEAKLRHIDPQELQAFQEHLSAKAQIYE